jgi:hypothetical protein
MFQEVTQKSAWKSTRSIDEKDNFHRSTQVSQVENRFSDVNGGATGKDHGGIEPLVSYVLDRVSTVVHVNDLPSQGLEAFFYNLIAVGADQHEPADLGFPPDFRRHIFSTTTFRRLPGEGLTGSFDFVESVNALREVYVFSRSKKGESTNFLRLPLRASVRSCARIITNTAFPHSVLIAQRLAYALAQTFLCFVSEPPSDQTLPQITRTDLQHFANMLEGIRPPRVFAIDPGLGIAE